MAGRDFKDHKSLELQDRVLFLLEPEQGPEAMVHEAVAAVRDRRAQLEQQTRANLRREDVCFTVSCRLESLISVAREVARLDFAVGWAGTGSGGSSTLNAWG
ncbi:hypothetical protein SARC_12698 [Sphaeroforma arctica JP610]|uniref:Uncharacterized protein n=1 Tax=Sphaeroforma arctica JP610 TaxID=667725 RepID=A0A0L0FDC0_9EUKA|nr:hypothetical protein SARC_12698 [Sphaeroforma arctica JP610]KNC74764.1 hypothetical protein SARC_12698 [Sphaeroforma arctica JP610]|eukprot:XP_014148666.1 hypothetical protein SARC_12698 [Sphaeroforma arctica JP610]